MDDAEEIARAILALIIAGVVFLMLSETVDAEVGVNLTLLGVLAIAGAIFIGIVGVFVIVISMAEGL